MMSKNQLGHILCENNVMTYICGDHSSWRMPAGYDFIIKSDGSISPSDGNYKYHTAEIITKPMTYRASHISKLDRLLKLLNKLGCEVNRSTGFHVHHGITPDELTLPFLKSLYNLCYRYEPVIYGLVAPSRATNHFCEVLPSKSRVAKVDSFQDFMGKTGRQRYGCNFSALTKDRNRSTIEFRYHHGTLDFKKIMSWMIFTQKLIEHSKNRFCGSKNRVQNDKASLYNLLYTIGMKANSKIYPKVNSEILDASAYLVDTWKKFKGDTAPAPIADAMSANLAQGIVMEQAQHNVVHAPLTPPTRFLYDLGDANNLTQAQIRGDR